MVLPSFWDLVVGRDLVPSLKDLVGQDLPGLQP